MLPGHTIRHGTNEAWDLIATRFNAVRMVITDRLHVHLPCVLSDIPNVLVADEFGKNHGMYSTWTHLHHRSRFASRWEQVQNTEDELTAFFSKDRTS